MKKQRGRGTAAALHREAPEQMLARKRTGAPKIAFNDVATPVHEPEGQQITEHKQAEIDFAGQTSGPWEALRQSEEKFRLTFDQSPIGTALIALPDRHFFRVNKAYCRLTGYSEEEMAQFTFADVTHPEDVASTSEYIRRLLAGEIDKYETEKRYVRKDGSIAWGHLSVQAVKDSAGRLLYMLSMVQDITQRKQTEQALKESEERYRTAIEHSNDGVVITKEGRHVYVNQRFLEMFGYHGPEEVLGQSVADAKHVHPDDRAWLAELNKRRPKGEPIPSRYEHRAVRKDGKELYVEASSTRIVYQGEPAALSYLRDVTERRQAELRLRESEDALKSLFNATNELVLLIDIEGAIVAANGVAARLLGREIDTLIGQNLFDLLPKEVARSRRLWARKVVETGKPVRVEDVSSNDRYYDSCVYPVFDTEGNVVRLAVYAKDITEMRHASRALAESEARFKQFFDSINDGVSVRDAGTHELLDANRRFCDMYGYTFEELKRLPLGSLAGSESTNERRRRLSAYYAQVTEGVSKLFQAEGKRKDGSTFWVEVNVRRITMGGRECLLAVARDITERREAEEALKESETRFKQLFDNVTDGIALRDAETFKLLDANRRFCEMWGYTLEELKELPFGSIGAHESVDKRRRRLIAYYEQETKGAPTLLQWAARRKDGSTFWVELNGTRITIGNRECLLVAVRDITKRKETEDALRESEIRFKQLFDNVNDGISVRDAETLELLDANRRYCELRGYTFEELKGFPLGNFGTDEYADQRRKRLNAYYERVGKDAPSLLELEGKRKDGSTFWSELNVTKIAIGNRECLLSVARDITERKRAEEKIRASLKEKEVLLKEVHHRVKNNLQIISSLLYLQATRTEHPGAVSALRESRARIKSMALIHERLYASPDLASVDMGKYTRNLVSDLQHSHRTEESFVRLTFNIEDIPLGINEAIPCGLIINELVSNALKHAFPNGREGEITIQLQRRSSNQTTLTVSDNGIGFPEHVDFRQSPSLGLTLVTSLVEQLGGMVELDRRGGAAFTITF